MRLVSLLLIAAMVPMEADAFMLNGGPSGVVVAAPLALDGTSQSATSATTAASVTMGTTGTSDVLLCFVRATSADVSTVADNGPGLAWTKRDDQAIGGGSHFSLWYATTTVPFSATVTATTATGGTLSRLYCMGISGASTTTPFDTSSSYPSSTQVSGATSIAPSSALSTNNPKDMLVAAVTSPNTLGTITEPSGYTSAGASGSTAFDASYEIVAATQAAITPTYTWTTAQTTGGIWEAVHGQ